MVSVSYVIAGKILQIDVGTGTHSVRPITESEVKIYLLGSGLAAKIYLDWINEHGVTDPLDPRSPLIVLNGLLSGTFSPTGCRSSWCGRSPLTGIWNEANLGGHWGAGPRFGGRDGIILTGKCDAPTYLWLEGERL